MQRYYKTILDAYGNPAAGVSALVVNVDTGANASLYSASEQALDSTVGISNPVVSSAAGKISFAVANGHYRIIMSGAGRATETEEWLSLNDNTEARFGGLTDYTEFEADGSMLMVGDATVFDDLSLSTIAIKVQGTGLSNNTTEVQTEFTQAANLSDYLYGSTQITHAWLIGSDLYPHLHWMQTTSGVPNWLLDYRWQPNGEAKETSWTRVAMNVPVYAYVSGTLNNIAHTLNPITPPANAGLSDIVQFKIYRDNANASTKFAGADPVAATAGALSFDLHIQRDRLGSRQEYIK